MAERKRKTLGFSGDNGCAVCGAALQGAAPRVRISVVYGEGVRERMEPCPRTGLVPEQLTLCRGCHHTASEVSERGARLVV